MAHAATLKALADITDTGLFERLATSVLREANPIYEPLVHTGVNTDGKTVKGPIDGVVFVKHSKQPHMISVHHTTGDRDKLEKKWLHDPSTVKRRKKDVKQEGAGDILKTIAIYKDERARTPDLVGTLVLTLTSDPSQELVRETEAIARDAGIAIDLWSASRMAHFLDTDPTGQWLRKQYLGIDQELLSYNLLLDLSRQSLDISASTMFSGSEDLWISRKLNEDIDNASKKPLSLVLGESGNGKSVACSRKLKDHIGKGGVGIVISHEIVSDAMTLDQAIFLTLQKIHPTLSLHGLSALTFCSADSPMMIIIEDVNRSTRPQNLIEKIIAWAKNNDDRSECNFHLLCPVWPVNISLLGDQRKKDSENYFILADKYSSQEAENAVLEKAKSSGIRITQLKAQEISKALGFDPLLIALHDIGQSSDPSSVIWSYINSALLKAEADDRSMHIASEYRSTLRKLAECMLKHKKFEVTWSTLKSWNEFDDNDFKATKFLAKQGRIISYSSDSDNQVILFRHDRVRDWLLSDCIKSKMSTGQLEQDVLSDPFYSELIGRALSDGNIEQSVFSNVYQDNPLSLFYALKWSSQLPESKKKHLLKEINRWASDKSNHTRANRHIRWHALYVLTETDSPEIPNIVRIFPENSIYGQLARLRNGDISGGIELCIHIEPGSGAPWRDIQIAHAKSTYGKSLAQTLGKFLKRKDIGKTHRSGALRLAGYIGDELLADAISACWLNDIDRTEHLDDYLWAFAQCWCKESENNLAPVMDAWARLPGERSDNMPSPRDDLAAHNLRWAFRKWPPAKAIDFFVRQAKKKELRWPITYMLHCMDDPQAAEFVVQEMANTQRKLEGTDKFSPFVHSAAHDWEQSFERGDRTMSDATRQTLLAMWKQSDNDTHTRKQAFSIWAASKGANDIDVLRESMGPSELGDYLIVERLKRGDKTAIPTLIDKISHTETTWWWQYGRYIWSDELTQGLDKFLEDRQSKVSNEFFSGIESDWIISELIFESPEKYAESILLKHWGHIRYCPRYVQAALYVATPNCLSAAHQAIIESNDPTKMLEYLSMHYGIKTTGRRGLTKEKQIDALIPYIDHLSEHCVFSLWEACNDKGWFSIRRKHLDGILPEKYDRSLWDKDRVKKQLDDMIANDRVHWVDYWIDDYLKTGILWEDIFKSLVDWLDKKSSEKGLEMVAEAVSHKGSRANAGVLGKYEHLCEKASDVICDTKFGVYRRTLN